MAPALGIWPSALAIAASARAFAASSAFCSACAADAAAGPFAAPLVVSPSAASLCSLPPAAFLSCESPSALNGASVSRMSKNPMSMDPCEPALSPDISLGMVTPLRFDRSSLSESTGSLPRGCWSFVIAAPLTLFPFGCGPATPKQTHNDAVRHITGDFFSRFQVRGGACGLRCFDTANIGKPLQTSEADSNPVPSVCVRCVLDGYCGNCAVSHLDPSCSAPAQWAKQLGSRTSKHKR